MVRTRQGKRLVVAEWSLVRHAGHASDIEIVLAGCDITEQRRNERLLQQTFPSAENAASGEAPPSQ